MPHALPADRLAVMGVLNVTPDSFSDGGLYSDVDRAVARAEEMLAQGADIVDVGGESTRPGAEVISEREELDRVLPVVRKLASIGATVSVDTSKPEVARACLDAGAKIINDVTALGNPDMAQVCRDAKCTVCLMHMQGDPRTMQAAPSYGDVVKEVRKYLLERAEHARASGILEGDIWIDPGIGFGKTVAHNVSLLKHLGELTDTAYPVLIGVSKKSFIGRVLGSDRESLPVEERVDGSLAAQVVAQINGARIVRTHNVKETVRAARIVQSILSAD